MSPLDRSHMTYYQSAIVTIALMVHRIWVIWRSIISWPWNLGQRSLKNMVPYHSKAWVMHSLKSPC